MYKGQLEGFPKEIVEKMLERQVEQGNPRDVSVFEIDKYEEISGFSWEKTIEGDDFWCDIIDSKNFDVFFERYPLTIEYDTPSSEGPKEELTFPRKMLCWDYDEENTEEDLVLAYFPNRNSDAKYIGDSGTWINAKELPQPTENERKAEELISMANELLELANKLKEGL